MENKPVSARPKISIQICTHREMNPFFVNALRQMETHLHRTNIDYDLSNEIGVSNLCSGRQHRLDDAINSDCTHIFFVDDDMVFPNDSLHRMLSVSNQLVLGFPDKDGNPTRDAATKVAIGVNPCRKTMQGLYYTAKGLKEDGTDDDLFMLSRGRMSVVEASRCGLGLFMIETALLRQIPRPHFEVLWNPAKQEHEGEDFYFIRKLRENGVQIFIDQELSQHVGHVGHYIYGYSSYRDEAPADYSLQAQRNAAPT